MHPFVSHPWYPASRTNVTGVVSISDGRPPSSIWAVLSTQRAADVFGLHEPTRFVLTDTAGRFTVTGVPPGDYVRYLQAAAGSITDVYVSAGSIAVTEGVPVVDVGTVKWTPSDAARTTLW